MFVKPQHGMKDNHNNFVIYDFETSLKIISLIASLKIQYAEINKRMDILNIKSLASLNLNNIYFDKGTHL